MIRDLMRAAHAKMSVSWNQTAHIMWLLYSVNRTDKMKEKTPDDFNPLKADADA